MFSTSSTAKWRPDQNLYCRHGYRKYLNAEERKRFLAAAEKQEPAVRLFCQLLFHSGCRLSEATQLQSRHVLMFEGVILISSLKKREKVSVREIPMPPQMIEELCDYPSTREVPLWPWKRTWAWQQVKCVMREAGIEGPQATSRGLRHSFGVNAVLAGIPLTLIQRWLGHSNLNTTAIYTNVLGPEEREMAKRMWNT